jgi:NADPH2:quinone reductase
MTSLMTTAVRVHRHGGPEVLQVDIVPISEPGLQDVMIRVEAAGVNSIDLDIREGRIPLKFGYNVKLPQVLGYEGAGVIEAVGAGVTDAKVGDRIVWATFLGSYASRIVLPGSLLVPLPDELDFQTAAAVIHQGMTAHFLSNSAFPLKPGDTCLVHGAAGGVGHLLCQMAKMRGARVIGTVSTEAKATIAREFGADEIVYYKATPFDVEVKRLTDGQGVHVVYDCVGGEALDMNLQSLAAHGTLINYGQTSWPLRNVDALKLFLQGSLFFTKASLLDYIRTRDEFLRCAQDVLSWAASGRLRIRVDRQYPLGEAAAAHEALAERRTAGKVVLDCQAK